MSDIADATPMSAQNLPLPAAHALRKLGRDLAVARAHVGSIEASLARVEKQAAGDDISRIKLNALVANLASTRTMYESFVTRLRATQDQAVPMEQVCVAIDYCALISFPVARSIT